VLCQLAEFAPGVLLMYQKVWLFSYLFPTCVRHLIMSECLFFSETVRLINVLVVDPHSFYPDLDSGDQLLQSNSFACNFLKNNVPFLYLL